MLLLIKVFTLFLSSLLLKVHVGNTELRKVGLGGEGKVKEDESSKIRKVEFEEKQMHEKTEIK